MAQQTLGQKDGTRPSSTQLAFARVVFLGLGDLRVQAQTLPINQLVLQLTVPETKDLMWAAAAKDDGWLAPYGKAAGLHHLAGTWRVGRESVVLRM